MKDLNNRYRQIKILDDDVQNDRLLELKEYLQRPVTIETEFGNFVLEREYAADKMLSSANDWLAEDDSITWYYLDGDMFWGHVIEIDMEEDGTYSDADIAG